MNAIFFSNFSARLPVLTHIGPQIRAGIAQVWRFLTRTGLLIPLAFLGLMLWRALYFVAEDFDYDEGINLMKALLYGQGYALYTEVWSDQPPLLTVILAWWFRVFGQSVVSARILISLFSATLLWSLYLAMRSTVSAWAALVAVGLLILSEYYMRLSSAAMVGLPALTLATASVAFLVTGKPRFWRVVVSAVVMALALQVKLMVVLAVPAVFVHLLLVGDGTDNPNHAWRSRLIQCVVWGSVMVSVFGLVGVYFQSLRPDLLITPHLGEETWGQISFIVASSSFLPNFYKQHLPYLIVAAVGVLGAIRGWRKGIILPVVWFFTTWLALTIHRPLWYHHVTLLTVPLAWLCAWGIALWIEAWGQWRTRVWRGVLLAIALLFVGSVALYPAPLTQRLEEQMRQNRPRYVPPVVDQLKADAAQEPGWVFTDRPFYAFAAGVPVPPPIAVMSRKRLQAGSIPEEMMLQVLESYRPAYVLLERFTDTYSERVMQSIDAQYDLVLEVESARYYRLKSTP